VVYEKLQIYELAQEMGNDWNIYIDSDTLINPDFIDITAVCPADVVMNNGRDVGLHRFRPDKYF